MESNQDVFISHSSADSKLAYAMCDYLEEKGIRCWIAPRDVQGGTEYAEAIIMGIRSCKIMVVLFNKNANDSIYVKNEVERAFNYKSILIPFKVDQTIPSAALELFLGSVHSLDATNGNPEDCFDLLYQNCARVLGKKEGLLEEKPVLSIASKKEEKIIIENLGTNDNEKEPAQNQESKKNSPSKQNKKSLKYLLIFLGIIGLVILIYQLNTNTNKYNVTKTNKSNVTKTNKSNETKEPEKFVDEEAEFPGGYQEMVAFIKKNLVFPETSIENNIQGKCFLRFVVSVNGTISNVTVTKGVPDCPECDKAAIKAIKVMPNWKPGKLNGRSVSSYCSIPINFATENNTQVKKKNKQIEAVKPLPILQIESTTISKSTGCIVKVGFGADSHFAGTKFEVIGGIVDNVPFNGNVIPGMCVKRTAIGSKVGLEVIYTRNGVRSAEPAVGLLIVVN